VVRTAKRWASSGSVAAATGGGVLGDVDRVLSTRQVHWYCSFIEGLRRSPPGVAGAEPFARPITSRLPIPLPQELDGHAHLPLPPSTMRRSGGLPDSRSAAEGPRACWRSRPGP
jgi:hypothetical protein